MSNKVIEGKKQIVEEIKDKLDRAEGLVLVDYRGLNVAELTELRQNCKEAGVDYKVYKNTMMRFAFKDLGFEDFNEYLTGPNGIAFGFEDPVGAAKVTEEFAKENKNLKIKVGMVDGKIIDIDEIKNLASLPSKEVLIAQALGGLNAPISGFANVLQGTVRKLVYALNGVKEKQEQEAKEA